ncbi:MAG: response regulator, partial [Chloroflexota bacterium]
MKKILLIEDDNDLRRQMHLFLTRQNYECISTDDPEEGIMLAHDRAPDMILCDVRLPNINGFQVLETLQVSQTTRTIPFIFISGINERSTFRQGMTGGATDYLTKPFNMRELIDTINAGFARAERMRESYDRTMVTLRTNLTHVLPHELRTPLLHIIGYSDMLYEDADALGAEDVRTFAEGIKKSSHRLEKVVENYLLFSQLEVLSEDLTSRAQFDPGRSNAQLVIQGIAQEVSLRHGRKNDLSVSLVPALVKINEPNLKKLVTELLDNAFKFSDDNTRVLLETEKAGDNLQIRVLDFGVGMKPAELEEIGAFMQFGRDVHEQQGLGLGLAIVIRLLDLH